MSFVADLWLPILLSAVFIFVISSIIHMVLPIHKNDFQKMANEDHVLASLREHGVQPGDYMFPGCNSMKEMSSPEMKEKFERGPVGYLTVMDGPFNMGPSLVYWFIYTLVVSFFVAYVASSGLPAGANYLAVFRLTGTVAVLAYATAPIPNSIWKGVPWSTTLKHVFDGLIYGLATAGTFGWLWPSGA